MLKNVVIALSLLCLAAPALALSTDEVIRLKQAGVSDAVIQKMIERESAPREGSGVWETGSQVIYQAAPRSGQARDNQEQQGQWQDMMQGMGNIIIDGRRPLPANNPGPADISR